MPNENMISGFSAARSNGTDSERMRTRSRPLSVAGSSQRRQDKENPLRANPLGRDAPNNQQMNVPPGSCRNKPTDIRFFVRSAISDASLLDRAAGPAHWPQGRIALAG
jgi:hypothetical protein